MNVGKITVGKSSVDKMTVGKMSVDKMTVRKMSVDKKPGADVCWRNEWRRYL